MASRDGVGILERRQPRARVPKQDLLGVAGGIRYLDRREVNLGLRSPVVQGVLECWDEVVLSHFAIMSLVRPY